MRLYLFILLSLFLTGTKAQNTETDSLKKSLAGTGDGHDRIIILEGLSYAYLSSYPDTALQYALEGMELAKRLNDRKGEALCSNALGNVYFHVGDYPKSLELYFATLAIEEKYNNRSKVPTTYFNIASVYTEEEDYTNALHYISKAKGEDEKLGDSSGILFDYYSLGSIYVRMGKNDSALNYIQQSWLLARQLNDQNMIGAILNTFGEAYSGLKNTRLASEYYRLSIPYAQVVNDNEVLASNYFGLAKGFQENKRPDSSIHYARKAILIAAESSFLKQVLEISAYLVLAFKNKNQFDSAFKYQTLNIAAKDSLFNVDKARKIQNLKFQEQQRLQTIETARIQFRDQVKFYFGIGASIIFLGIAFILWRNSRQKQKAYVLLQQQKSKAEQAFQDLKSAQAMLVQSEKMASLGELTAGIAHEIQNPLNFVNNFSEVNKELLAELKAEAQKGNNREVIAVADDILQNEQRIHHHGMRAGAIIENMLEHSRNSRGQLESTDINLIADEYLRLSYNGFRTRDKSFTANIKTDFGGNIGNIKSIPQDLGRVFLNLYNNAFYAIREKIKAGNNNYEPVIAVITRKLANPSGGSFVEIVVQDNGIGIPQKILSKIFQPFFTTKPTGEGSGLGLSLSYDIIKSVAGEIKAESVEGEFTRFTITLLL